MRFTCPTPNGDRWWVSHELMAFKRTDSHFFYLKWRAKSVSGCCSASWFQTLRRPRLTTEDTGRFIDTDWMLQIKCFSLSFCRRKNIFAQHTTHKREQPCLCAENDDFWTATCSVRHLACDIRTYRTCTQALCFWFYTCQGVGANNIGPHRHHWHCMSSSVKCWVPISFTFQVSWLVSAYKSLTMVIISYTKAGRKTPSQLNTWKVSDKKKVTGGTSNQTCFKN